MKIIALVALSIFAAAANADPYLCVAEESTGFAYENEKWGRTYFDVSETKYIVRKIKKDEGFYSDSNPYGVFELGSNFPDHRCFDPSGFEDKAIICRAGIGQFFFIPETGRYLRTYTAGYWDGKDDNDNTPLIERGRCSKI